MSTIPPSTRPGRAENDPFGARDVPRRRLLKVGGLAAGAVAVGGAFDSPGAAQAAPPGSHALGLSQITVKHPFILSDPKTRTYALYTESTASSGSGILCYTSRDLRRWSGPTTAYTVSKGSWAAGHAPTTPRVVAYRGAYYLFVTLHDPSDVLAKGGTSDQFMDTSREGTIVARASSPVGPFVDLDSGVPATGRPLMTTDGTLYVDPVGTPYLVYAHDWVQKIDGVAEAVRLDPTDLGRTVGDQFSLFRGSDAAFYLDRRFGSSNPTYNAANTDQLSPFKVHSPQPVALPNGGLAITWTTNKHGRLAVMQAVSRTGSIHGPWDQAQTLLDDDHAGAEVFRAFTGQPLLAAQNRADRDAGGRLELYSVALTAEGVRLRGHLAALDGARGATVRDTTPPDIYVPSTRVVTTASRSARVHFTACARDDRDGGVPVTYSIPSGSVFRRGTTRVTVRAGDRAGNHASRSFLVKVAPPSADGTPSPAVTDPAAIATAFPLTMPRMGLHDPFILADRTSNTYFLYTSNDESMSGSSRNGVMAYQSKDLVHWSKPALVYTVPTGRGAWNLDQAPWAPEVHLHRGRYYLFTTLHNPSEITDPARPGQDSTRWIASYRRATILAVADTPTGPFVDMNIKAPVTDPKFDTLDGTLYVDPSGNPYLVFANEWIQKLDGTIDAIPLTRDLSRAAGEPIFMFKASDAPWWADPQYGGRYTTPGDDKELSAKQLTGYVTDGPELYTTPAGSLVSLWSSYRDDRYIETQAISRTGSIEGPWEQLPPLIWDDKGHGMVFTDFAGDMHMVMHNHMSSGVPRGEIYDMRLTDDGFQVLRHREDLDGVPGVDLSDTLAPRIYLPPTRIARAASPAGARVEFTARARDNKDAEVAVHYSKAPGSRFPIGTTSVTVTATDAAGNTSHAAFDVVVRR